MGSGEVSAKYNVVRGAGPGHYFPTKIIKNSGVLRHLEAQGNISHKKRIKIVGSGELCTIIMCSRALFGQSLFNDKIKLNLKITLFRFASFSFFLEGLIQVRCIISIGWNLN